MYHVPETVGIFPGIGPHSEEGGEGENKEAKEHSFIRTQFLWFAHFKYIHNNQLFESIATKKA